MPIAALMTTQQMIAAVYDWLGTRKVPPSVICTKLWAMLGKLQSKLQIADKTHFFVQTEPVVGAGVQDFDLGDLQVPFGGALSFERVDRSGAEELCQPVPLISDIRDMNAAVLASPTGLAAVLYRNADGKLFLRFSQKLPVASVFRLFYEPASFARPKLAESPLLPQEGFNLLIIETAFACLSETAKIYEPGVQAAYVGTITAQKQEFGNLYDLWRMKNNGSGVRHRRAYNESRRGGRGSRYRMNF